MPHLDDISGWITEKLPALLAEHKVPGAAIGVYSGGEIFDFASGVLSHATGVAATPDSVFQVGSITKTWTATLVMQLADEGLLDLDATVVTYLPDFDLADSDAAKTMTVRQLLCHKAGFEGDVFTDTGNNDDCVEKYVATLRTDPQLFPPDDMFSYNNAGYCVLGRIIEVLRGKPFDQALREHLFAPLGLTHAATDANSAILFRAAVGHLPNPQDPDGQPVPAPMWSLVKSNAPAGAMLAMRPRDLLAFAAMHLNDGKAADGTQVLSAASATAMRDKQVTVPPLGLMGTHWGLGFELFDFPTGFVFGHDGGTVGQSAFLRIVPGQNIAIALLTNGGNPIAVYFEVYRHLLKVLADIDLPDNPVPPTNPDRIDAAKYLGTYANSMGKTEIAQDDDGRIWMTETPLGELAELIGEVEKTELVHLENDTLIAATPKYGIYLPQVFIGDDGSGRSLYIHSGRAIRRAE
ncbi:MAG TPA: serine hydrolase domain-containing protein [Trebonia sp.]|jgi:CubicO group peptidase (beta-lactamase class C family)